MRSNIVLFVLLAFLLVLSGCIREDETSSTGSKIIDDRVFNVSVYTTKGDKSLLLAKQPDLKLKQQDVPTYTSVSITLNDEDTYQTMDGFGAALTESSAYLINHLPDELRKQVIHDLFSEDGIRMNFIRLPMGASDFALSSYTYNDRPEGQTDVDLEYFTIARDEVHVIPILKEAFQINDQIKLMGSPWSAPAWMKENGSLNGGRLKKEYYDTYANYFVKFIQAYEAHGLPIYAITPQNEPLHESDSYPTMKMEAQEQLNFIKVLGPRFKEENIETKIIAYDHNWDRRTYPYPIFRDTVATQYVAGTAFHCYAGDVSAQSIVHKAFPDKGIWFTECSGGQWATNFSSNLIWNMENLFIGSVNNYSKGVLLWNIALDENYGPKNGGCQDCRGVIEVRSDGTIKKNEEYYAIGHFSKFIEPNAVRIGATVHGNDSIIATAFRNPNQDLVLVVCNKGNIQLPITISYDGLSAYYHVPAQAVSTIVIHRS